MKTIPTTFALPLAALLAGLFAAAPLPAAEKAQEPVKLLFSTAQDITNTWGQIHFGVTPLQLVTNCENPGFELSCCLPRSDGAWDVYGQVFKQVSGTREQGTSVWSVVHATTRDGMRFEDIETVFTAEPGPWTGNHALAYNPDAKEFLLLKLKVDDYGFGYTAFFSPDGRAWQEHPQRLFYDGDAISLFWSTQLHRFVLVSKGLQPYPKHFRDHGGVTPALKNDELRDRRVLAFRTSPDGRKWEPSDSMADVWNRRGLKKPRPDSVLTLPDANDPPDLEFYSGNGFWYYDRCYLMVLNYAASPLAPDQHGPHLDTEWWVGHDGLHWERPGRGVNATGAEVTRLTHNPLLIGDQLLLHYGNRLLGMKRDRVSFVSARANAEFSTRPFVMPAADLVLNAAVPAPERRPFAESSAYVMADVLDERGQIVSGFEAKKCVIQKADGVELPLRWGAKSACELAGRQISLRFHLRSANIYAVTTK
jgi:hypothetical protein